MDLVHSKDEYFSVNVAIKVLLRELIEEFQKDDFKKNELYVQIDDVLPGINMGAFTLEYEGKKMHLTIGVCPRYFNSKVEIFDVMLTHLPRPIFIKCLMATKQFTENIYAGFKAFCKDNVDIMKDICGDIYDQYTELEIDEQYGTIYISGMEDNMSRLGYTFNQF